MTECNQSSFGFAALYRREVVAEFDGGDISTDAGGLLLREVNRRLRLTERLAGCFTDHRQPDKIEHQVSELVAQRLYGLALGYEDLNDHDQLRADPLMGVLVGKPEPNGTDRRHQQDQGARPARARAPSTGWS